jgi:Lrp/AsnC family transcriptional regulator for asnA, asnC and gidA
MGIDPCDRAIIARLQQNGRASYASIASAVGLSPAAVRQRVGRLRQAGKLRITAVAGPSSAGAGHRAVIRICCSGDTGKAADGLAVMAELCWIVQTAGTADLLTEAVYEDDQHLLGLISRIRSLPQVARAEVGIALRQRKPRQDAISLPASAPPTVARRRGGRP